MSEHEKPAKVMVLMATCDGAAHLEEQLNSLAGQTWPAIDIRVSDDGSTDGTMAILLRWREKWAKGEFTIVEGPRAGFAENFRSLITTDVDAPFCAFCDQDDLWEPDKLERATGWLGEGGSTPRLFCSRTLTITEDGRAVGHSPLFPRPPSFRNALVQSIAGGNTMVLNRPAFDALARACARSGFVSHDWWAYLIVTGAGGAVEYCAEPLVRYRQHALNLVGANSTFAARTARLRRLVGGEFAKWHDTNLDGLEKNADLLTPEAAAILKLFRNARGGGVLSRLRNLRASGVYRQTRPGEIALYAAAILGRL